MGQLKVFDTNAMIAVSSGILSVDNQVQVSISIITRLELLGWPQLTPAGATLIRQMIDTVQTVNISPDVEAQTILLRSAKLLKLPDAIVAATALSLSAPLVTNDLSFQKVSGLVVETF